MDSATRYKYEQDFLLAELEQKMRDKEDDLYFRARKANVSAAVLLAYALGQDIDLEAEIERARQ